MNYNIYIYILCKLKKVWLISVEMLFLFFIKKQTHIHDRKEIRFYPKNKKTPH